MRVLMVSPYPPLRDGVGKYAAQEVTALRAEGQEVEVLAPVACGAHFVEDFKSGLGLMKLSGYAKRYDRVILQYQPAHYHRRSWGASRVWSNLWMWLAFRSIANLTIVCHEVEYPPTPRSRLRPESVLARSAWKGARDVAFHTEHELEGMRRGLGVVPRGVTMRDHGAYFRAAVVEDTRTARTKLDLDPAVALLLCIGFIQPQKGFDRAIRAFRRVPGEAKLIVTGSIRAETHEHRQYLDELVDLALGDPRVEVRETVLSDEEFDRWILASDVVILPYREIWSSGVLERARVLDRPVIAMRAGGMTEQIRPGDVLVGTDEELAQAIAAVVGCGAPEPPAILTFVDALAFVREESTRRREEIVLAGVDRALADLDRTRGVQPIILPSQRPFIGPLLDLAKRVMRRGLGWLLTPMLGQINEFERSTLEAMRAVVSEGRGNDPGQYAVFDYPQFEAHFRGPSESVKDSQRAYVKEFIGRDPVLDVGCGRGEFLELLKEAGVDARGIDLSVEMIALARNKGLNVEVGDGVAYMRRARRGSFGGIFASQVVEHLPPRALVDFLAASRRALRPGGILICETINPQSLFALANWYFMDLTHAQPVHPNTLTFLAEEAGFADVEVRYLSPARPDREPILLGEDAPEWAQQLAKTIDEELRAVSDVVFGAQDYALVARVP